MRNTVFAALIVLCLASPANSNFNTNFEDTFDKWLAYMGINAKVQEVRKRYNEDGFIDEFYLQIKETPKVMAEKKFERNLETYLSVSLPSEGRFDAVAISLINKDIQDIPFMWSDWVGKLVFSFALKKIASTFGLQLKIKKVNKDNYQATFLPAPGSQPSRYRFNQITIVYNLKELILNAVVRIYTPTNYLPLQYVRGELQAILKALEQGVFPGSRASWILASQLSRGSLSDYLLHETLGTDEESYSNPEELERILPLKAVEAGQELVL
jgi:hypothetical protein